MRTGCGGFLLNQATTSASETMGYMYTPRIESITPPMKTKKKKKRVTTLDQLTQIGRSTETYRIKFSISRRRLQFYIVLFTFLVAAVAMLGD